MFGKLQSPAKTNFFLRAFIKCVSIEIYIIYSLLGDLNIYQI